MNETWRRRDRDVTVVEMQEKPDLEPLARYLRALRESRGMAQDVAADLAGVKVRQWQRWEAAESEPSLGKLRLLSERIQVPLEDIVLMRPSSAPTPVEDARQLDRIEEQVAQIFSLLTAAAERDGDAFVRALEAGAARDDTQARKRAAGSGGPQD